MVAGHSLWCSKTRAPPLGICEFQCLPDQRVQHAVKFEDQIQPILNGLGREPVIELGEHRFN